MDTCKFYQNKKEKVRLHSIQSLLYASTMHNSLSTNLKLHITKFLSILFYHEK